MKLSLSPRLALPLRAAGAAAMLWMLAGHSLCAADAEPPVPPVEVEAPVEPAEPVETVLRPRRIGDVIKIFGNAHVRANETADQVVVIFGNALIEGRVNDQVVVVFGKATIKGDVDDQVVCVLSSLTIGPGVHIRDQVVSIGSSDIDPSAYIDDQLVTIPLPTLPGLGDWIRECLLLGRLYPHTDRATWSFVGIMLLFNLAFAGMFRSAVDGGARALETRPAAAFFNGLMGAVLLAPILALLAITVIGALVVPFVIVAALFATVLGVVALYRHCGAQLGLSGQPLLALVVGHLVFALLYAVPAVGLPIWALTMTLGLGTALTAWSDARRREARNKTPPPSPPPPATPPVPPHSGTPTTAPEIVQPLTPPTAPLTSSSATASEPQADATTTTDPSPTPPPPQSPPPPPVAQAPAPPPASATHTTGIYPRADLWPRLLAVGLDFLLVVVAVNFANIEDYMLLVWFAYHVAFWTWRATTLGGIVLHLRIERLDGRPIDFGTALVRALGSVLSTLALGFGFWSVQWDPDRQSWHDKFAGTTIVNLPRGQPLV